MLARRGKFGQRQGGDERCWDFHIEWRTQCSQSPHSSETWSTQLAVARFSPSGALSLLLLRILSYTVNSYKALVLVRELGV